MVIFGGGGPVASQFFDDTWEWDVATYLWKPRAAHTPHPSARRNAAMAYDAGRVRAILFGATRLNVDGNPWTNDTWEYDGSTADAGP